MRAKRHKKPKFLRQEWFRFKNIRRKWLKWRKPRGLHSKLRRHIKGKGFRPQPGYGTPKTLRGLHPCGLKEVLVSNKKELAGLNGKTTAVRIAKGVGALKRAEIQAEAARLKIKVLNPKKISLKTKKLKEEEKSNVPVHSEQTKVS